LQLETINPVNTYFTMKKLFVLFAVAGFVLSSCGGNTQEQEETQAVEQADSTTKAAADSAGCCDGDSTAVEESETQE
jgi:hypothetical protein